MNPTEGMMIRDKQSKEIYLVTLRTTENIYIKDSKGLIGKLSLDEFKEEYEIVGLLPIGRGYRKRHG